MDNNTKTAKGNRQTAKAPTSYNDITIQQWENIVEYMKLDNEFRKKALILSELTGKDISQINDMKIKPMLDEYNRYVAFMDNEIEVNWKAPFSIDDILYTPILEFIKWQTWRAVAFMTYAKEANIAGVLAVRCYKDKKEVLTIEDIQERIELFKSKMSYGKAYSLYVFFCEVWRNFEPHIVDYLKRVESLPISVSNGGGILPSTRWQVAKVTLLKWKSYMKSCLSKS
jgi:hypothetical protein